jgi:hypothetical protein
VTFICDKVQLIITRLSVCVRSYLRAISVAPGVRGCATLGEDATCVCVLYCIILYCFVLRFRAVLHAFSMRGFGLCVCYIVLYNIVLILSAVMYISRMVIFLILQINT